MTDTTTPAALSGTIDGTAAAIDRIAELTRSAQPVATTPILSGVDLGVLPEGHQPYLVVRDDQRREEAPDQTRGQARLDTLEAWARYVNLHRDDAATTVWINHDADSAGASDAPVATITAVLDDHTPDASGWGQHTAFLPLVTTPEWRHWLRLDGRLVAQIELSEHLHDGQAEVVKPDAATMIEIAQSLQIRTAVDFVSAARTRDGQVKFRYEEEQEAKAGASGGVTIPDTFTLRLAAFEGTEAVELVAALRWRATKDGLRIGYKLQRPAAVLRAAVNHLHQEVLEQLEDQLHDRVYRGKRIPTDSRIIDDPGAEIIRNAQVAYR